MSLGDIQVDLRLMTAKFSQGINKANSQLNDLKRSTDLAKKAVGGFMAALAVREVVQFVGRTVEAGAAVAQVSERLGVASDWLTQMTYAAGQFGVQNDALVDGIKELSLRADEFIATGAGPAEEAFTRLGLKQADLNKVSGDTAELFELVSARLREVENVAARQRLVDEIFGGTGGEQMADMASASADQIQRLREEADALGITMSKVDARRLLQAQESINRARASFEGMARSSVSYIAPTIVGVLDEVSSEFAEIQGIVSDPAFEQSAVALAGAVTSGFKTALEVIKNTGRELRALGLMGPAEQLSDRVAQINDDLETLREQADLNIFQRDLATMPVLGPGIWYTDEIKGAIRQLEAEKQLLLQNYNIRADIEQVEQGIIKEQQKRTGGGGGGGGGPTKQEIEAIQKKVDAMKLEAATLRMTTTEAKLYELAQAGALPYQLEAAKAALDAKDAYDKEKKALEDNVKSRRIANEIISDYNKEWKEEQAASLDLILRHGTESQKAEAQRVAESRAVQELTTKHLPMLTRALGDEAAARDLIERAAEEQTEAAKTAAKAGQEMGFAFSSAFEDAIIEGKKLSDVLVALGEDIQRIILRNAVTAPLGNALGSVAASFGAGLFGGGGGGASTNVGNLNGVFNAKGNVFEHGDIRAFANGGVVHAATMFPMATGVGVMGEAGPEAIMPLTRGPGGKLGVQASGGGGGVLIQVFDQRARGQAVETQETRGPDGQRMVRMWIRDEVNAGLSDGSFDRSMRDSFGVRRRGY
ncbi:phage tail tape measure protein [Alloalcanivorax sp. C16-1]|uniref:phage tail tape measure protein n=1 Tax=Alloalcanivorax sp. C16-1 TaxID=3390051 RepID=UPI003970AE06